MALDPSIPLQARGIQLESPIAQAGGVLNLLGLLQQQKLREQQMAQAAQTNPLQLKLLQAQIEAVPELAAQRRAATAKATADAAAVEAQRLAQAKLAGLFTPRGYGQGAPVDAVAPNDQAAIDMLRAAGNTPMSVGVPNPANLQSLMLQAAPQQAIPALIRAQTQTPQYSPAGPGSVAFDRRTGQFIGPQVPFAPREPRIQPPPPPVQTIQDSQGNWWERERGGSWKQIMGPGGQPLKAPPKPAAIKLEADRKRIATELSTAIAELEKATKDGGLIDQSTGSGAGAMVDAAGRFVGYATPGAIAVGALTPIYDLVLKLVPRFEGPQSDKDTKLYQDAAGQLANPAIPNEQKKAAGKEILRLMKARRGQFVPKDLVGTEADAPSGESSSGTVLKFDAQGNLIP